MYNLLAVSLAVLLRVIANPLGNVFQKQLTAKSLHPLLVNFATYALLSVGCITSFFFIKRPDLTGEFWMYAVLDGILGALGNGFLVKALQKGDLSVLGPINSYKSVVSIVAGIILLGEVPNAWGLAGIGLIIGGSYFVLDTTDDKFSWALFKKPEIQYRIWALVLTAVEAVITKKMILLSSPGIVFISWCCFGALFSFLLLPVYKVSVSGFTQLRPNITKLLCLVMCIGIMQLTTNYVFDNMDVGYALSLFQLSVIISVVLGYKIFNEGGLIQKLIGSAIMIAGSVLIILLK